MWQRSGRLSDVTDVLEGLDRAPAALVGLLAGENIGKRMVRVGPDPSPDRDRVSPATAG